jgi:hypothetical protein
MRPILICSILLTPLTLVSADTETLYTEWTVAQSTGNYPEALILGMKLIHASQEVPRWDQCDQETPFEVNLLFDIGNTLMNLSRWEEAKFCLTFFLVHVQTENELARTFGPDFSKAEWLRDNKIEDQPFFQDTLPRAN